MTRDDIIRLAREAGLAEWHRSIQQHLFSFADPERLEHFATLVAAAEREACARVCEPQEEHDDPLTAWKIAAAIRARGEKC